MSDAIELSASTRRLIVYGILSYFGLFAYATLAESEPAAAAAEVAFGLVAVGIGAVLYREADGAAVVSGAAGCLIAGGVLQFVHLATRLVVVDLASTLLIYAGIGLYVYAALRG